MDLKDKKILGELVLNSRIPLNRLAKKVGLSREVVTYRINQLKKKGIIQSFHSLVDEEKLGYSRNTFFIQLKGMSLNKEKEFLDFLMNHSFVTWMGPVIGKWNVVFDILSKNRLHLDKIIKEIQFKVKDHVSTFAMAGNTIFSGYYPEKIFDTRRPHFNLKSKKIKLDKLDLKILKLLNTNSRIEYSEMSRKLKLSANAIKYRIKNLEESGVIMGYTISANIRKLGYNWYNIQAKFIEEESKIKDFLKNNENSIYHYHYVGNENWDIDVGVIAKDPEELRKFIVEFKDKLSDFVKIHDVYIVLEVTKENILPEGVFD